MASVILSDNGVSSGSAGLKSSADSTGSLALQTTTSGGTATTAVTIDTSQNVGIGTASPRSVAGYTTLALNNTNGGLFDISATGTRIATIGADTGGLTINALANMPMTFFTNNAERMRIDSSGNVGIGTTSPNIGGLTRALTLNTSTGGNYSGVELAGAGTLSARFVTNNTATYFGTQLSIPLVFETNATERMRVNAGAPILCLAGGSTTATGTGIAFPATQSASSDVNTLDDYEEGTWTPVLTASTGTITVQSCFGSYVKIGKQVTLTFRAVISSGTVSAIGYITGFPFIQENTNQCANGTARETNSTGFLWEVIGASNASVAQLILYNNSSSVAAGYGWNGSITYITP